MTLPAAQTSTTVRTNLRTPRVDPLPAVHPGFEAINRYRNPHTGQVVAKLHPGEYYVANTEEQFCTVLGTTVALVFIDDKRGVTAMLHFALPHHSDHTRADAEFKIESLDYGRHAIEALMNGFRHAGGRYGQARAMLFGGTQLWGRNGRDAAQFAQRYLQNHGILVPFEFAHAGSPCKVWISARDPLPSVQPLKSYNDTIQWREERYHTHLRTHWIGAQATTPAAASGEEDQTMISEHKDMLRMLKRLDHRFLRQDPQQKNWRHGIGDALSELQTHLRGHFEREERSELFLRLPVEFPPFRATLDGLKREHVEVMQLLGRLQGGLEAGDTMDLLTSGRKLIATLRRHERIESTLLHAAYTIGPHGPPAEEMSRGNN